MTSARPPFGLHIGLPRTGTKTLQWQLLSRHPQIHYFGIWTHNSRRVMPKRPARYPDSRARDLFDDQILSRTRVDLRSSKKLWQEMEAHVDPDKVTVWSEETLARNSIPTRRARAENAWRILGPCRVLLTLREPIDHLESIYRQILRRHQITRAKEEPWLKSIDEWFEDPEETPFSKKFEHDETVRIYRDLFGAEAVKVMLFEQLREDPRAFFAEVCNHFGVDPCVGADLYADRVDNARISDRQVRRAAWLRNRPRLWRVVRRVRPLFLAQVLYRTPRKRGPSSDVLSESNAARVRELSRPQNRWLQEELGLPLEKYGYPF